VIVTALLVAPAWIAKFAEVALLGMVTDAGIVTPLVAESVTTNTLVPRTVKVEISGGASSVVGVRGCCVEP